jgi:hypothetical protein
MADYIKAAKVIHSEANSMHPGIFYMLVIIQLTV